MGRGKTTAEDRRRKNKRRGRHMKRKEKWRGYSKVCMSLWYNLSLIIDRVFNSVSTKT